MEVSLANADYYRLSFTIADVVDSTKKRKKRKVLLLMVLSVGGGAETFLYLRFVYL